MRAMVDDDLPAVLELLSASLGWVPDEQYSSFFAWKHHDNPFGRSPAWVAVDGERIVGLRVWLRWEFEDGARTYRAVRAVDTATHPDFQGRGIFKRLTLHALDAMRDEGVDFVFNTPNSQSRPGYLKMGWEQVGKLPTAVRFSGLGAALRTLRARVPADKWSVPSDAGVAVSDALRDDARVSRWLSLRGPADGRLRTRLDAAVLRWRYGFGALHYRALHGDDGLVVFRLRMRGPAREAVVCLVLAGSASAQARLLSRVARESGADHVLRLGSSPPLRAGFLPLPGQGPILTWRELTYGPMPRLARWDLSMGDVELL